jgi:formylglycine-generating enzyme required for sulfatase activity
MSSGKITGLLFVLVLITAFNTKKKKAFLPPGTVQINDTLFADECEISNLAWREYVEYNNRIFGKGSIEYTSSLPDTLVWRHKLAFCEPYVEYYFRHPAYSGYPVVGLTYEQAVQYCKWRTERVHVWMEIQSGKRSYEKIAEPYTGETILEYRLPTRQEWEALALIGPDQKLKEKYAEKNNSFFNFKDLSPSFSKNDSGDEMDPVRSYLPNKLGLYNLFGNAAEMILEKGISKGGSWKDDQDYAGVWKDGSYSAPDSQTGFRCVCVMKK